MMKKRIPAWMMLPALLLALSFNFVARHNNAPALPDYTKEAWYSYLDSENVGNGYSKSWSQWKKETFGK